jgi:hypothetical protein
VPEEGQKHHPLNRAALTGLLIASSAVSVYGTNPASQTSEPVSVSYARFFEGDNAQGFRVSLVPSAIARTDYLT